MEFKFLWNFINLMENRNNTATPLSSFPFVPPSSVCVSVLYLKQSVLLLPATQIFMEKLDLRLSHSTALLCYWLGPTFSGPGNVSSRWSPARWWHQCRSHRLPAISSIISVLSQLAWPDWPESQGWDRQSSAVSLSSGLPTRRRSTRSRASLETIENSGMSTSYSHFRAFAIVLNLQTFSFSKHNRTEFSDGSFLSSQTWMRRILQETFCSWKTL